MPRRPPQRDPIGVEVRRERAQRRVGYDAICSRCGETRPEALIEGAKPMLCARCPRKASGHSVIDLHHVAGQRNDDTTIPVPVNDHRAELTPAMYDWPEETRENPDQAPLLANAGRIRGVCKMYTYLIEKLLLPSADSLEDLHRLLSEKHGKKYWAKPDRRRTRSQE